MSFFAAAREAVAAAVVFVGPLVGAEPDYPPGHAMAELAAAPPEGDWFRFPPRPACQAALRFNRAVQLELSEERKLWHGSARAKFDAAISEAERLYQAWDVLDDAQSEHRRPWQRRLDLARLRTILGADAYAAGEMPPAAPTWLFRDKQ